MIEFFWFSRSMSSKCISCYQRQCYGRINVTNYSVRQFVRIDLAPADCFGRCGSAEAAGVRASVGNLEKIIVSFFIDPKHLLYLRFGLQCKVLWRAAAEDKDRGLAASPALFARVNDTAFGGEDYRRCFVHIEIWI